MRLMLRRSGLLWLAPIVNYSSHMVDVMRSSTFDRWLRKLKDRRAAARVLIRIGRLAAGNPGDVNPSAAGSPNFASTTARVTGSTTCTKVTG